MVWSVSICKNIQCSDDHNIAVFPWPYRLQPFFRTLHKYWSVEPRNKARI